jgi:7,8-dihydroneopterin aldolase/epimerase/oxygenase
MTHAINIEGIRLYAYHGCLEEEANIGGHYVVDVYMTTNFAEAAATDDLEKTIDYCTVYEICKVEMGIRNKLIETVAQRIFIRIKEEFSTLKTLHVKLTKLTPPMNGDVDNVSVEIKD